MSSLPEKSQQITATMPSISSSSLLSSSSLPLAPSSKPVMTKTFFFRTDSIRKIKCTAAYPFQVAGLKLSKSALIELLETNIKKARICTQKAMLNFYCMILKLLSTLFAFWDEKVQRKATPTTPTKTTTTTATVNASKTASSISLNSESSITSNDTNSTTSSNESPLQTYQRRIAEKLVRIQKQKRRLSGNSLIPSASSSTPTPGSTPISTPSSSINDLSRLSVSSSTESLRSFHLQSQPESKIQKYCLVLCVHAGLVVMYLQVVILGIALNTTNIPSGLVFMLVTIGVIGYLFVKVSLVSQKSATEKSPRSRSPKHEAKNTTCDPIKDDFSPERQSRSRAKKIPQPIDFNYKTLSKVKLL